MSVMYMETLFPVVTQADIVRTKALLKQYREKKQKVIFFEMNPPETESQAAKHAALIKYTRLIERAVEQIIYPDVRSVIEYRFIKGNSRAATILHFSGWDYSDKTIDRKIIEGTESVANTLLYLE
ncbi:hypothetical protein [Paenibacillus sp. RC84]|uniref:hypothetical protein n=1 Tax=Paenibacillus sp. RC84 TaxID=3156252 RepID=UPI003517F9B0